MLDPNLCLEGGEEGRHAKGQHDYTSWHNGKN